MLKYIIIFLQIYVFFSYTTCVGQNYQKIKTSNVAKIEIWCYSFAIKTNKPLKKDDILKCYDSHVVYSRSRYKDKGIIRKIIRRYNRFKINSTYDYTNIRILCTISMADSSFIDVIVNLHETIIIGDKSYYFDEKLCNLILDQLNPLYPITPQVW